MIKLHINKSKTEPLIMMNKERFQRVIAEMKKQGLKQILVADDPSILWLTGRIVNQWRCGAILIKDDGDACFMNNLFCFLLQLTE